MNDLFKVCDYAKLLQYLRCLNIYLKASKAVFTFKFIKKLIETKMRKKRVYV